VFLDIGCGRGKFIFKMAEKFPSLNFVGTVTCVLIHLWRGSELGWTGLEIRKPFMVEANAALKSRGLRNLAFVFHNIMDQNQFRPLLNSLVSHSGSGMLTSVITHSAFGFSSRSGFLFALHAGIQAVAVNFPDPWFKARHHKRRAIQPAVVQALGMYVLETEATPTFLGRLERGSTSLM
jgi:tRNA (guanine-N7-)-methyltransferase